MAEMVNNSEQGQARKASSNVKRKALDVVGGYGKVQPQARDLEEAVLGALLIEKDALTKIVDVLRPEYFYDDRNKRIYTAILALFSKSEPVDLLTVTNQLRITAELDMIGGAFYLVELTNKVNSSANIEFHARIITEYAIKRELITIASEISTEAFEDSTDVFELLDKVQAQIFQVTEATLRKSYMGMKDLMRQALIELEARKDHKDGLTGVPSGFSELDRITSGWQKSDLVIVAARPGMGKTAFVVSALRNAAVDHKKGVAIFSLEMPSVQLVNRLISAEAELEGEKLKKGSLADHEWVQLHQRVKRLTDAPIFIDDTPGLSILELRAKARRLKSQHDIQLIIIDYLQLMTASSSNKGPGNREQEISQISRSLKMLAKELSIPVIALSQLSRAVETRGGDKRPMLSDLRESGAIEQDADMIIFLYRPEYYQITEDENGQPTNGVAEVIIAKHRNGSLDTARLRFIGKYTKFGDLDTFGGNSFNMPPDQGFNSFPQVNGMAAFDTPNTSVTFGSKLNGGDKGKAGFNSNEEAPF